MPGSFGSFFSLGVQHILGGNDHLVFLLGLWLGCVSLRLLVWIITSFTVAHSLTLVLASLRLIRVPDSWVEVAIGASIAYVGIENLLFKDPGRKRVALTFVFGLLHGLGFSNVLRDALPADVGVAIPLVGFNLGVEFGQLLATVVCLPLIWWLRQSPKFGGHVVPAGSAIVAAAGVFWMVARLLG